MKTLVCILSVYLLVLCCYPCVEDNCTDDHTVAMHEAQAGDHDASGEGSCTPFCFDGCCTTKLICQASFPEVPSAFRFNKQPDHYDRVNPVAGVQLSIWQPPKV